MKAIVASPWAGRLAGRGLARLHGIGDALMITPVQPACQMKFPYGVRNMPACSATCVKRANGCAGSLNAKKLVDKGETNPSAYTGLQKAVGYALPIFNPFCLLVFGRRSVCAIRPQVITGVLL